jgi:hypothetical protein
MTAKRPSRVLDPHAPRNRAALTGARDRSPPEEGLTGRRVSSVNTAGAAREQDHLLRMTTTSGVLMTANKPILHGVECLECLGRGSFGKVWTARDLTLMPLRAVKW